MLTNTVPRRSRDCEKRGNEPVTGMPLERGSRATRAMPITPAPSKSVVRVVEEDDLHCRLDHLRLDILRTLQRHVVHVVEVRVGAATVYSVVAREPRELVAAVRHHGRRGADARPESRQQESSILIMFGSRVSRGGVRGDVRVLRRFDPHRRLVAAILATSATMLFRMYGVAQTPITSPLRPMTCRSAPLGLQPCDQPECRRAPTTS